MADTVVGLTIVEECVRAAEVRRPSSKNPILVRYGEVPLPPGAAGDSEIIDSDAVALALRQLWADAGFSTKRVVLGLGNRRILVRDHTVPPLPLDQIRRALPFQVQDMLPVPVEEAVLDFYPLAEEDEEVRGLLVVAVADMVTELIDTVHKAKLKVDAVDLAPFGLVRAASHRVDSDRTVMVTHIGAHTSYMVVMRAGAPVLVRIVPGGVPVRESELGRHRAEIDEPLPVGGPRAGTPEAVAEARMVDDFALRVRSTVEFYVGRHPDDSIDELYVCGEGACHQQILPALDRIVAIPSKHLSVGEVVGTDKSLKDGAGFLSFVTPVGLALRSGT
ncbi:pilus assembly protein PilM [Nocardioides sp. Kera G14]|uniref:pilus assembly protein PilM n=1 Tax=Nocardioides sp. Kera G14 TaxID=2884264 RepID=UPI001D124F3E|nr:pilus assembly protein PilM [Nocardioides sp. Kera G14]UDY23072.1 pilus assembly protein PilM [Nocardioides sp. Kera G14]